MANWPPRTQEDLDAMAQSEALQPVTPTSLNPISELLGDIVGTAAPKDGPLAAMVWKSKKNVPAAIAQWAKTRGLPAEAISKTFTQKEADPNQIVKFLQKMKENAPIGGATNVPITGGMNEAIPKGFPADLEAARAYWMTRRPGSAGQTTNIRLKSKDNWYGLFDQDTETAHKAATIRGSSNPVEDVNKLPPDVMFEKRKKMDTLIRALLPDAKAGTVQVSPSMNPDILELMDTLTHEGRHALQSRQTGHANILGRQMVDQVLGKPEWVEPQAYKAGALGKKDFAEFMTELMTRRAEKEPVLEKALKNDPELQALVDRLEKRTRLATGQ